jgi:NADPH:quinone reductase-like Zn-dependent oxidoreductase
MSAAGSDTLAVVYDAYGGPEVLKLRSIPSPRPAPDEILVEVCAVSMNPVDWKVRSGMLQKFFPVTFPTITGDGAGEVRYSRRCGRFADR